MLTVNLKRSIARNLLEAQKTIDELLVHISSKEEPCLFAHKKLTEARLKIYRARKLLLICFLEENLMEYFEIKSPKNLPEVMKGFRLS